MVVLRGGWCTLSKISYAVVVIACADPGFKDTKIVLDSARESVSRHINDVQVPLSGRHIVLLRTICGSGPCELGHDINGPASKIMEVEESCQSVKDLLARLGTDSEFEISRISSLWDGMLVEALRRLD